MTYVGVSDVRYNLKCTIFKPNYVSIVKGFEKKRTMLETIVTLEKFSVNVHGVKK